MKVYLAGPMFGKPELNEELFRHVARRLKDQASSDNRTPIVIVPHDIDAFDHAPNPCPPGRHSEGSDHNDTCYLRTDIQEMLNCDVICLLPGWPNSLGARLELSIAAQCGLKVLYYDHAQDRFTDMSC